MPNHVHALIEFGKDVKSVNTIVSNGKRFIAYEIVKRLKEKREELILSKLAAAVDESDTAKGKKHQVFQRSFDCKLITNQHFFLQKLAYIHNNPCTGVWNLVKSPVAYVRSSAKYYENGEQGLYLIEERI